MRIPQAFQEIFKPYRVKTFLGGRGSAKSESVGRYLLIEGLKESQNIVCGREFQSSIKDSVHSMLAYLIEDMRIRREYDILDTELRGKNGTRFTFVGVRHNIQNIKSMHNIKKFWGEEAQTFSQNSLDVIFPTVRAPGSELIFTMNPALEEDPAYQTLVVNPQPNSLVRKVNYTENPFFPQELEELRQHHEKTLPPDKYANIWLGECLSAVEGAIFAKQLQQAAEQGRITNVPYDPTVPVCTYWDLGKNALTAIWFVQYVGMQWRVLRHYSNRLEELSHYLKYVQDLPYLYDKHYLPHDGEQKRLGMVLSIKEQAAKVLKHVEIVPRVHHKADAINAAQQVFPLCWFDKELCADGLSDLRHYAYKITEEGKISNEPEEGNFWRDTADAFMTFAQTCRVPKQKDELEELLERQKKRRVSSSKAWWK